MKLTSDISIYPLKVLEGHEKYLWISSSVKKKFLPTSPNGREWATSEMANVGRNQMSPGIRALPLKSANCLLGGRMSGLR